MARRDARNDAALDHLLSQLAWGPMRHGAIARLGQLASDSDDLSQLFGRELRRAARTCLVIENSAHERGEFLVLHSSCLRLDKT